MGQVVPTQLHGNFLRNLLPRLSQMEQIKPTGEEPHVLFFICNQAIESASPLGL